MHNYSLSTGELTVIPDAGHWEAEDLFSMAERRNPKRAFLFVSKVLGRHIPVAPQVMRTAYRDLAGQIAHDLPGPVLFIGMAETAVGLAAGVHQEYCEIRHQQDVVLLTSTRHPVDGQLMCEFVEAHSHATDHLIYWPKDDVSAEMVRNAKSLVLVDDEATTGNTFANLLASLMGAGIGCIEQICTVTLTDWSNNALANRTSLPVKNVALMTGRWQWQPQEGASLPQMPSVNVTASGSARVSTRQDWGRLGKRNEALTPPQLSSRPVQPGEKILVLGTGEFVWPPFLLAEQLAHQGADVKFSAITRSPIAVGMAINNAISFSDNYGLGIPNFVYNVTPEAYDRVVVCIETPVDSVDVSLVQTLNNPEIISYAD